MFAALHSGFLKLIWMLLACDILIVPVPAAGGNVYAVKWVCHR